MGLFGKTERDHVHDANAMIAQGARAAVQGYRMKLEEAVSALETAAWALKRAEQGHAASKAMGEAQRLAAWLSE